MSSAVRRRQQLAANLKIHEKVWLVTEEFGDQVTDIVWRFEDECGDEYHTSRSGACRVQDEMDRALFVYEPCYAPLQSPVRAFADSKRWMARLEELFAQAKAKRSARSKQRRLELAEQRRRDFGIS